MKLSHTAALVLLAIALPLQAAEFNAQWKPLKGSMADLVGSGYSVIAVVDGPPMEGVATEMFFLQKGTNFCKCTENHISDVKSKTYSGFFMCWELTQPYEIPRTR